MRVLSWVSGVMVAVLLSAAVAAQPARFSFDYPAIAERVIRQLRLQPGEKVLLVAMPGLFEDLVPHLRHAVMKAGGVAKVDAAIMMPGAVPAHPVYAAMQDWLREGKGRTVHFHWLENGSAYSLPGQPLPPRHVIDATYQRALLGTDYAALEALARRAEAAMRGGGTTLLAASVVACYLPARRSTRINPIVALRDS